MFVPAYSRRCNSFQQIFRLFKELSSRLEPFVAITIWFDVPQTSHETLSLFMLSALAFSVQLNLFCHGQFLSHRQAAFRSDSASLTRRTNLSELQTLERGRRRWTRIATHIGLSVRMRTCLTFEWAQSLRLCGRAPNSMLKLARRARSPLKVGYFFFLLLAAAASSTRCAHPSSGFEQVLPCWFSEPCRTCRTSRMGPSRNCITDRADYKKRNSIWG